MEATDILSLGLNYLVGGSHVLFSYLTSLYFWLAAVLLLGAARVVLGSPSNGVLVLLGIILTPLFLKVTGLSLSLGDPVSPTGQGQTFPVGVMGVFLFACLIVLKMLKEGVIFKSSALNLPILTLIYINVLILLIGLWEAIYIENFLFSLQTIAPMLCFFIALNSLRSLEMVKKVFLLCAGIMGTFVLSLIGFTAITAGLLSTVSGGMSAYLWIFPIYTLFDYVPLVVAVGYGLGLALVLGKLITKGKSLLLCLVLVMLASLFFLHSRGALLTAALTTLVQLFLFRHNFGSAKQIAIFSLTSVVIVVWLSFGAETLTGKNVRRLAEMQSEEKSVQTRRIVALMALQDIAQNPFTGLKYVAKKDYGTDLRRIANPHNQYLTYGVRSGLIAMFIFISILWIFHKRLLRTVRTAATVHIRTAAVGLFSVFLAVSVVSNMFQDNFIQPYSGFVLWFLMGTGEFLYLVNGRLLREGSP